MHFVRFALDIQKLLLNGQSPQMISEFLTLVKRRQPENAEISNLNIKALDVEVFCRIFLKFAIQAQLDIVGQVRWKI